jgi:hypothetical protein
VGDGFTGAHYQDPMWSGLIDRNFEIMRQTSPFPDRFANGFYNSRPFIRHFGHPFGRFYPGFGGFYYPGYALSLGSSLYGFVPSVYSTYGSWYPPYLPVTNVYIIEPDDTRDRTQATPSAAEREEPSESSRSSSDSDSEYYLAPRSGETVEDALADIRHAWMNSDFTALKSRLRSDGRVRIYLKGKYKYSVDAGDFAQMTQDAMSRIDTVSFTLDRVTRQGGDRVFASGKHVYNDPNHVKHEVYVSYLLVKEDGHWKIAEAGSSTEPITAHSD